MRSRKVLQLAPIAVIAFLFFCFPSRANCSAKGPTAWWPDPVTGLMWTNTVEIDPVNWEQANGYCSSLNLGGFSGWRVPTLDESKTVMVFKTFYPNSRGVTGHPLRNSAIIRDPADALPPTPYDDLVFDGGLYLQIHAGLWTSTKVGDSAWTLAPEARQDYHLEKVTSWRGMRTFCVRSMEPSLLQLSKDAHTDVAVPDVEALKAYVPIAQAHASFKAAHYQSAITQANGALAIKPKFAPAYWAMGVCYGMLGQWDQAVANLQSAVKIDKNYNNGRAALKWAQAAQKAAKKGEAPKEKAPVWE